MNITALHRQIARVIGENRGGRTLPEIARLLGHRNHTVALSVHDLTTHSLITQPARNPGQLLLTRKGRRWYNSGTRGDAV